MLDAIFQFTDFEAFQGAELDTEVVLSHRKLSRTILQKKIQSQNHPQKSTANKEATPAVYQQVGLSGKKDQTSSGSTVKKQGASYMQFAAHKLVQNNKSVNRTEGSPEQKDLILVAKTSSQQTEQRQQQSIQSEIQSKSYFNKPSRDSVISSNADTLGKRRFSADPRQEKPEHMNTNDSFVNYQSSGRDTNSSKQATNQSRFIDQAQQAKVYASLHQIQKNNAVASKSTNNNVHATNVSEQQQPQVIVMKTNQINNIQASLTTANGSAGQMVDNGNYQINAAQYYNRHLKQQNSKQSVVQGIKQQQQTQGQHSQQSYNSAGVANGINKLQQQQLLQQQQQSYSSDQRNNVNIQNLISEYKQKLSQAIRKEDKELIMKNIVAYQQMIGGSSNTRGAINQAQPILNPSQMAQLGVLGMAPPNGIGMGVQSQQPSHHFQQQQMVIQTQPPQTQPQKMVGLNIGSNSLQKRKGSKQQQQQQQVQSNQIGGVFMGQGSPVMASIPSNSNNANNGTKKSKSLNNQMKQQRLNNHQQIGSMNGSSHGRKEAANGHQQQIRAPSARNRQGKKGTVGNPQQSLPTASNGVVGVQSNQPQHNRSQQQLVTQTNSAQLQYLPQAQQQQSRAELVGQVMHGNQQPQQRSRNVHHMPQIGGSSSSNNGPHQMQMQFKSAQNAYQGGGSNSVKNIQTIVSGNSLNQKFSHNYSSQTPNANGLRQGGLGLRGAIGGQNHSQSHAQMTTQSSSPQYASVVSQPTSTKQRLSHSKNANQKKKSSQSSLRGVQPQQQYHSQSALSYN